MVLKPLKWLNPTNVLGQYFCTYFGPLMNQYDGLKVARPSPKVKVKSLPVAASAGLGSTEPCVSHTMSPVES